MLRLSYAFKTHGAHPKTSVKRAELIAAGCTHLLRHLHGRAPGVLRDMPAVRPRTHRRLLVRLDWRGGLPADDIKQHRFTFQTPHRPGLLWSSNTIICIINLPLPF